ncbi:hypothetical protein OSB04_011793 [Centaurea solstitialis]|uniref:Helitron helicase-like domain-containing protein n=1 Tax=Centaurea solstitialis TaxID=347529 RepID=A0AA38WPH0_9ASTR|nr:hypothetical protein OSB04_011793 [Centaurea solstitialis]
MESPSTSSGRKRLRTGEISNRNEYRKEAIVRWRKKRGKCPMVPCVFLDKKQYRKEAMVRWKKKRNKCRDVLTSRLLMASGSSGHGKTIQNSLSSVETSDYMRRQVNNMRGKHLLQQISFAADILPDIRRCRHCDVVKFHSETENFCCLNGGIVLSTNEVPVLMQDLLTSTSEEAHSFRTFIRTYNNHFAFTSLGVTALPILRCSGLDEYNIILKTIPGQDQRVFNKPEVSQVVALWVEGEKNGEHGLRNIKIPKKKEAERGNMRHVSTTEKLISLVTVARVEHLLAMEENDTEIIFFRTQQDDIRQEFLQGNVDVMANGESEASSIGRRVVLPANFYWWAEKYETQIYRMQWLWCKILGNQTFFTLTCNPNWPEIKKHMMSHEETHNRADLVVRVAAYTYVVEFQKRSLPHAHFLLILECDSKMYKPEEYDEVVCAEIPDTNSNPHLYNMVVKHMLHGPCGKLNPDNVCMKNGTCKNSYPKDFCNKTTQSKDAHPTYRRRDNGVIVIELNLTYVQYPDHFTWKANKKLWSPRQSENSIGRIVIAHPSEGERYYLRILLSKIRCPKSYDDLKICNGVKVDTFRESALLRGYLIDDNSQQLCLQEAAIFHMP